MTLRLFGLKKKGKAEAPPHEPGTPGHTPQDAEGPAPAAAATEPVEFVETSGAPAAASPPESETVPAAVGAAKALRAVRARGPPARKAAAAKRALTPKQRAQRKYAASMAGVRKRAKKASGGKGRIAKRSGATKLRRQLGLKPGKSARKAAKKGARKKR